MTITQLPSSPGFTPAEVVAAAESQLASLDDVLWAAKAPQELLDTAAALERLKAHIDALQLIVVAEIAATEAAKAEGWASAKDFMTHVSGHGPSAVRLAKRLSSLPLVTEGLRDGGLTRTKADIIANAIHELPTNQVLRDRAEAHLVAAGRVHDPRELRRLARRLLDVVDPDKEDREAEKALAREERVAQLNRTLALPDDQIGGTKLRGNGSVEDGALIRAVLLALAAPVPDADGSRDIRDHGARMWDALVELCRRQVAAGDLPQAHGSPVRLLLTMTLDQLTTGLGDVTTGTGETMTATAARRLACDAEVIPAVLDSTGRPLDVGHTHRLVTPAIFIALMLRDHHCAFPGCTRPPVMCHAHHIVHWADGGKTSLDNLVLVCGAHHRLLHNTPWEVRLGPDGKPEFRPPPIRGRDQDWTRDKPPRPPRE